MFFDSVALKKNSWHYKLQQFVLGRVPYTNNFCPYFWLTIFCTFAFPFVALFKGARLALLGLITIVGLPFILLYGLVDKIAELIERYICAPFNQKKLNEYVDGMTDEDAYHLTALLYRDDAFDDVLFPLIKRVKEAFFSVEFEVNQKLGWANLARWKEWKNRAGDNWEERLRVAREAYKKRLEEEEQLKKKLAAEVEAAEKRRKAFFNSLVKYTKYLVLLVVGAVAIELLYWLSVFVLFIVESWGAITGFFAWAGSGVWWLITECGPWVVLTAAIIALLVGLITLVVKMCKKCMWFASENKKPGLFKRSVRKVSSVLGFFVMYFKAFKENNCPAIQWEDDAK